MYSRRSRAIFEPERASKYDIWRFMDFHQKSRISAKILLNSFFLQNAALSHQTVLVASQFVVTESIAVTFGGPRRILNALEQLLSLRWPQNAIFGGLWIFTKNRVF